MSNADVPAHSPRLLGESDPAPFEIQLGDNVDWLIVCDHASNRFPAALGDMGLAPGAKELHIAWDIGAAMVAERLAERLGAPLVRCNYSRLVIDCNRYPDAPDAMPAISDGVAIPANVGLTDTAREARIAEIFEPYQRVVAYLLDKAERMGRLPVLLSIHSCSPVMNGAKRPWEIGLGWVRDARTAAPLLDALRRLPRLQVGDNEPYGLDIGLDFTTPEHAMARGLAHAQVEFRNDLIATPAGARRYADIFHDALVACAGDPRWHARESYLQPDDGVRGMSRFVARRGERAIGEHS